MKKSVIVLLLALFLWHLQSFAVHPTTPTSLLLRICDGIGRQYCCVSSSMKNQYGFGGVGDTLTTDSTVSRGTLLNVRRVLQGSDPTIVALLSSFYNNRTNMDSSYMYSKWSSICLALNNAFADSGGLN